MITALAGGVGAAKLLVGISKIADPENLTIVVNTGDDIELHGLHISADLDIITYSLAGIVNAEKGWGIHNDTFACLESLRKFTGSEWFNLGDRDLATHLFRTEMLRKGLTLTEVTATICRALKLRSTILPMTDDRFETHIVTKDGRMHFEEYLIKKGAVDEVLGVEFLGADKARPAKGVVAAIENADTLVVCPSNPVVSIGTILSVKGIRDALKRSKALKVAVSPIIAGAPVKGPADKLLSGLGHDVSALGVARLYSDFLDVFIIDAVDAAEKKRIEELGLKVKTANTLMLSLEDKVDLAKIVLENTHRQYRG